LSGFRPIGRSDPSHSLGLVVSLAVAVRVALLQQRPGLLVGLRRLLLRLLGLERLQLDVVVVSHPEEGDPVAEEVDGGDGVADDGPGEGDEQPVLDDAGDVHGEGRRLADEQEDGEVEREGAEGVGAEDEEVRLEAAGDGAQPGQLDEDPGHDEEGQAAGRDVVERGDGVERDALGGEEDLDEDEARGLEGDGGELQGHAARVEAGLAVRGDGDAERDGEHVEHGGGPEGLLLEEHPDGVDGDGHQRLEHLDEGDGEVDVRGVGEPERERVEGADGHHGGEVEPRRHGGRGREVHDAEDADERHGEGGAEGHVHHGQGDGEGPVVHLGVQDVLVVDDHREGEEDPHRHVHVRDQDLADHRRRHAAVAAAAAAGPFLAHGLASAPRFLALLR
jgi:hypothetical protein